MRGALMAVLLLSSLACAAEGPQLPGAGEVCDAEGQCAEGLDCMHLVCVDDRGPRITIGAPEQLQIFDDQLTSLSIQVGVVDVAATDQVELIIDPGDQEHHELLAITGDSIATEVTLPAALTAGPHHLRARIVDRDGQPHPNPSASAEVVVFVRDQVIPDTPQIAVVWPPDGYRHRVGNPLEVEVAVLAGSFTFVERSDQECKPLADCEPAFGLECEDQCGPVSREGHARIYMLPEYPGCLLGWPDLPIGCNGDYASSLRPGSGGELLDEHRVRGVIRENLLSKPGMIPLHAGLSYSYHDSYPSDADVIHESITIEVID